MRAMKKIILLFALLFFTFHLFSQNNEHKIDSLEAVLKNEYLPDSTRMKASYDLALKYLYNNDEKTLSLTDQTIALADKLHEKHFKGEALSLQGVVYKNKGEYKTAIDKHFLSLKI